MFLFITNFLHVIYAAPITKDLATQLLSAINTQIDYAEHAFGEINSILLNVDKNDLIAGTVGKTQIAQILNIGENSVGDAVAGVNDTSWNCTISDGLFDSVSIKIIHNATSNIASVQMRFHLSSTPPSASDGKKYTDYYAVQNILGNTEVIYQVPVVNNQLDLRNIQTNFKAFDNSKAEGREMSINNNIYYPKYSSNIA